MEPFLLNKSKFIIEKWTCESNLVAGFTCKKFVDEQGKTTNQNLGLHVGDVHQNVVDNRHMIANEIGIPLQNWVGSQQTHGCHIKKISCDDVGQGSEFYDDAIKHTDGLYTNVSGVLLTQFFADCVPVYFRHKKSKMIGIAHAGWKGTALGIAGEMIRIWRDQEGIQPTEVEVVIGPSVCKKCYIVDEKVIHSVDKLLGEKASQVYATKDASQFYLDLKETNELILLKNGVLFENIYKTNYCTNCGEEYFFSHRREQGNAGRMMGYIGWLESNESSRKINRNTK